MVSDEERTALTEATRLDPVVVDGLCCGDCGEPIVDAFEQCSRCDAPVCFEACGSMEGTALLCRTCYEEKGS